MLRIFYGPDTFSRTEAVNRLKTELDADGMLSINTNSLEGAHLDVPALLACCDTVPFLAPHRLVVVRDLIAQAQVRMSRARSSRSSRSREEDGAAGRELLEYLPRMPATTTLLLLEGPLREDNALLRALRPLGEVRVFAQLNEEQLGQWIVARARAAGSAFEPRAIRLLVQSARGDLWVMAGEVEKLALYAQRRTVTEGDVQALVASAQESNVFLMVDAIVEGRIERALLQLELLLQAGAAAPYLITMIARQYRQLIIAEDLVRAGASQTAIAQAAEIRSDSAMRRILQQARRRDAAALQRQHEQILEADLSIKRGIGDERVVMQMLVAQLAGGGSRSQRQVADDMALGIAR